MPHARDQSTTTDDGIVINGILAIDLPIVYINSTQFSYCINYELTNGQVLSSFDQMLNQKSCKPNIYNAGNLYDQNAVAASVLVAGKDDYLQNTICPRGWMLSSQNDITYLGKRSFYYLYKTTYNNNGINTLSPQPFPLTTNVVSMDHTPNNAQIIYWSARFNKADRPYYMMRAPGGYGTEINYRYVPRNTLASLRCVATDT